MESDSINIKSERRLSKYYLKILLISQNTKTCCSTFLIGFRNFHLSKQIFRKNDKATGQLKKGEIKYKIRGKQPS